MEEWAPTGGDGSPDVMEQVASTEGFVVAWRSQHEEDLMKLSGISTEVYGTLTVQLAELFKTTIILLKDMIAVTN